MANQGVEHYPTEQITTKVFELASKGISHVRIAKYVGISVPTLHKYYQMQLTNAEENYETLLADGLAGQVKKGNIAAIIFALKCKFGWSTVNVEEVKVDKKEDNLITQVNIKIAGTDDIDG